MSASRLRDEERLYLLRLARQSIAAAVNGRPQPPIDLDSLAGRLREPGACFVTLTEAGDELRGCIGTLEAHQPLAADVREHAAAAAMEDTRFAPVSPDEVDGLHIEISVLTPPQPLEYGDPADLLARLRPGIDGVTLRDGWRRATFLPQVWDKLPDKPAFLAHLCQKMGAPADLWRKKHLEVETYQVEEFSER